MIGFLLKIFLPFFLLPLWYVLGHANSKRPPLSFSFSVNNLMRNTYEASGIIIDVLPIVMFHSGMCVCVCLLPNEIGNPSRVWQTCSIKLCLIQNDGNKKWRYKVNTILNLESDDLDQFVISRVTLNKILLILIQYQYHTLNKIHFDLENEEY